MSICGNTGEVCRDVRVCDSIGCVRLRDRALEQTKCPNSDGYPCVSTDTCDAIGCCRVGDEIEQKRPLLPTDNAARKAIPIASGVLDYFPSALIEVAKVSKAGNDQHNPGEPLHWARGKSMQQDDTMLRHFLERGTIDPVDGLRHSAKLAWRALAALQLEMEALGAPVARGAKE